MGRSRGYGPPLSFSGAAASDDQSLARPVGALRACAAGLHIQVDIGAVDITRTARRRRGGVDAVSGPIRTSSAGWSPKTTRPAPYRVASPARPAPQGQSHPAIACAVSGTRPAPSVTG